MSGPVDEKEKQQGDVSNDAKILVVDKLSPNYPGINFPAHKPKARRCWAAVLHGFHRW